MTREELDYHYERHIAMGMDYAWFDDYMFTKEYFESGYSSFKLLDISQELGEIFLETGFLEIPDIFEFIDGDRFKEIFNQDFEFKVKADGLAILPKDLFNENYYLKEISLFKCKIIMDKSFFHTLNLDKVYIPEILIIKDDAFNGSGLKAIDLTNVVDIGFRSFYNVKNCKFEGKDYLKLLNIGNMAFKKSSIEFMNAPNIDKIGDNAFNNSKLKEFKTEKWIDYYRDYRRFFSGCDLKVYQPGSR